MVCSNMSKGKVVIIGSGRSGRGLLGELCFLDGYEITFADIDKSLIEKMKKARRYISFRDDEKGGFDQILVKDFDAVHIFNDRKEYIKKLSEADIIFTATFDDAFNQIITDVRESVDYRIANSIGGQTAFVVGANYVGLYDYFRSHIEAVFDLEELRYFNSHIVLTESIIYRISSFPTDEQRAIDELSIQNENYNILRVNTGQISKADKVALPSFFLNEDDTLRYMRLKIWKGNTLHCSLAFMGQYYGLECICDDANDDYISRSAYYAYQEAYQGLVKEYGIPEAENPEDVKGLWNYYRDRSFRDTNIRVGNDPIRKLSRNDRFIDPALICLKHGILPVHICQNAAYGFFFQNNSDQRTVRLSQMIEDNGIEQTIRDVCGLDLKKTDDKVIYDLIYAKYLDLNKNNPVDAVLNA